MRMLLTANAMATTPIARNAPRQMERVSMPPPLEARMIPPKLAPGYGSRLQAPEARSPKPEDGSNIAPGVYDSSACSRRSEGWLRVFGGAGHQRRAALDACQR